MIVGGKVLFRLIVIVRIGVPALISFIHTAQCHVSAATSSRLLVVAQKHATRAHPALLLSLPRLRIQRLRRRSAHERAEATSK